MVLAQLFNKGQGNQASGGNYNSVGLTGIQGGPIKGNTMIPVSQDKKTSRIKY